MRATFLFSLLFTGAVLGAAFGSDNLHFAIEQRLRADPVTRNAYVRVDSYNGLAVIHGWVRTPAQRRAIEERVRATEGVTAVYNYTVTDFDETDTVRLINEARRIQVSMSNANDDILGIGTATGLNADLRTGLVIRDIPAVTSVPPPLAREVKLRMDTDPLLGVAGIRVDSYQDLVILHGMVSNPDVVSDAVSVASRTPGVKRVLSYIAVDDIATVPLSLDSSLYVVDLEPRFGREIREVREEPVYVRYEHDLDCEDCLDCR